MEIILRTTHRNCCLLEPRFRHIDFIMEILLFSLNAKQNNCAHATALSQNFPFWFRFADIGSASVLPEHPVRMGNLRAVHSESWELRQEHVRKAYSHSIRCSERLKYVLLHHRCQCDTNMKCLKLEDDVSISAYVYRCREVRNQTILPPS